MARERRLAWTAVGSAVLGFAACLVAWRSGTPGFDVAWAPTLDLRPTRGRNALSSALLGSVSAGVVGVADRPVGLVAPSVRDSPG